MKKTLLILLILSTFYSCDKYLEVKPSNILALSTYDDVKSLMGGYLRLYESSSTELNGIQVPYSMENYLVFQFYSDDLMPDTYLDNWKGRNNKGLFLHCLQWKEEDIPATLWKSYYSNIGFFNTIIDELNNIDGVSEDDANIIKGEAKFLRAWCLFKLMQYFSPYHRNDLGIPVNLDSQAVGTYDKERQTQETVYNIIITELEEILGYTTAPTSFNRFYDKKLIHALLAKVYHFKGGSGAGQEDDWNKAIEHAKAAMEGRAITSIANFSTLFTVSKDGISKTEPYALYVQTPKYPKRTYNDIVGYIPYMARQYAREELYSLYDEKDIRRTYFVGEDGLITKLGTPYGLGTVFFFRIADLQLIIAESYARSGDNTNAQTYLEEFQANRIEDYTGFNGSDILQEILDERRREFCFEYDMRWIDLIRIQKGWSRPALDDPGAPDYVLEDNDYRFAQPIPLLEELQYNRIQQNPGWPIF